MHNQLEVSYADGTNEKFHVAGRSAYTLDLSPDGHPVLLTIYTVEGRVIEINWPLFVKRIGYHPAPVAKKNQD